MTDRRGDLRIGTSGYQYDHWRGTFYPEDLTKDRWFEYYGRRFDTVEINNTFYHLPQADTFDSWRDRADAGFRYALKFSRYGSHLKCLKDPDSTIAAFLERAERLGEHLGPILVQLRPNWGVNVERLDAFLDAAPESRRWAVELRDRSWLCDEVFEVLRDHGAALCIHDMLEDHPHEVTADWVYYRFHGDHYQGSYSDRELGRIADRISSRLDAGLDVYAFFNNDDGGYAPQNALTLKQKLE